ncbi:putative Phosphoglycolate phosphatase [Pillotina sp. SPG140]|jgi:phosphoglycolate phosphatase/putative hydrolase of the HAD superfamily
MIVYSIPERIEAFLFDMDSTLYSHTVYETFQIDALIERCAVLQHRSVESMRKLINDYRIAWSHNHDGQTISFVNTFVAFGISVEESIRWRSELYEPARFLSADPLLRETLCALSGICALVTNNPVIVAQKTLQVLGISDLFPVIVGLDSCFVSKPDPAPFLFAVHKLNVAPQHCIFIGDRYDIDLATPLQIGMGAILVDGVEDVYQLKHLKEFKHVNY